MIATLSHFEIDVFCISKVLLPYSKLYEILSHSPGNLPSFLSIIKDFLSL